MIRNYIKKTSLFFQLKVKSAKNFSMKSKVLIRGGGNPFIYRIIYVRFEFLMLLFTFSGKNLLID